MVAGGSAAVSDAVVDELARDGAVVRRIGGASRYETAALLADEAIEAGGRGDDVAIATGRDFPDGLAAGPTAVQRGGVLLLTDREAVPAATREWLVAHDVTAMLIAGGEAAVSDAVVDDLLAAAGG